MLKPRTIIILLFSLLIGILAVKVFSLMTSVPRVLPAKVAATPEKRPVPPPPPPAYSDSIPKGKRVVSVMVNDVSAATRELVKGDRVDLIGVTPIDGINTGKIARPVLQNVIVHSVEATQFQKKLTDKVIRKKKEWTVQLLLDLSQAVTLASMDEAADLRLVLRHPDDQRIEDTGAVFYSSRTGAAPEDLTPFNLTGRLAQGMRAISLPANRQDGLCDTLVPGDRVDVVVSFKLSEIGKSSKQNTQGDSAPVTGKKMVSRILFHNLEVLATDQTDHSPATAPKPVTKVTLAVTPSQAERLAVATDGSFNSKIRYLLRSHGDTRTAKTKGIRFKDLAQAATPDSQRNVQVFRIKGAKPIKPATFQSDEVMKPGQLNKAQKKEATTAGKWKKVGGFPPISNPSNEVAIKTSPHKEAN